MSDDPAKELREQPVISVGSSTRIAGIFSVLTTPGFEKATLVALNKSVELIQVTPYPLGGEILVGRVPDEELDAIIAGLVKDPAVRAASKSYIWSAAAQPNDTYWPYQQAAGLGLFKMPSVWQVERGHPAVRVAVIDSGVNPIPELASRLATGVNVFPHTWSQDTTDEAGHGTAVAAVIAATRNDARNIAGIAPGVTIVPIKACEAYLGLGGLVECLLPDLQEALGWVLGEALDGNVHVVNMSIGDPAFDSVTEEVLEDLVSYGVIIVAAAGNDGVSPVFYPARSEHAIAVGGIRADGSRHPSSNFGSDLDFVAPFTTYSVDHNDDVRYVQGTSFAAPVYAGLAAIYKSSQISFADSPARFEFIMRGDGDWNQYTGWGINPDIFSDFYLDSCTRFDFNFDREITVIEDQRIAYLYGAVLGESALYNVRFDLEPYPHRDGDIDIKDLQFIFGRNGATCAGH